MLKAGNYTWGDFIAFGGALQMLHMSLGGFLDRYCCGPWGLMIVPAQKLATRGGGGGGWANSQGSIALYPTDTHTGRNPCRITRFPSVNTKKRCGFQVCSVTVAGFWGKVHGQKRSHLAIQEGFNLLANGFRGHRATA